MLLGPSFWRTTAGCAAAAAPAPVVALQEQSELPQDHDARAAYHRPASSTSKSFDPGITRDEPRISFFLAGNSFVGGCHGLFE